MSYESAQAFRMALEQRLLNHANETGISLARLRRRVVVERVVARLTVAEPGQWVLKGGMALEVRLRDDARLTRDIDLGLRDVVTEREALHDRLVEALTHDPFGDRFELAAGPVAALAADGDGQVTWRSVVTARLAGRPFDRVQTDISPRPHELGQTETVPLPNSLAFAGVEAPTIEIVDVARHAAEKLHAMLKTFADRENTRVRDLVDLVILVEHDLLEPASVAEAARQVWIERNGTEPPRTLGDLPAGWSEPYQRVAAEHDLTADTFPEAIELVKTLWSDLFPGEH